MSSVEPLGRGTERPRALAVGCGGAGCNALRVLSPDPGFDVLALNDLPHPSMLGIKRKLLVAKTGLQEVATMGERAVRSLATTAEQAVAVELADAELVAPIAGLGGEMGSWGANLVARVAALKGATVLAAVTLPFSVEGSARKLLATSALNTLRTHAHGVLALPNDPLIRVAPHLPILKAFEAMSKLTMQPVRDLLRVLTRDDLGVLKSVLRGATDWQLGVGEGLREHPELAAIESAFESPWISRRAEEARRIVALFGLPGPDDRLVRAMLHDMDLRAPRASVAWGQFVDPGLDRVRATVLLGF